MLTILVCRLYGSSDAAHFAYWSTDLEVLYCQADKSFYIAVPQLAQRFSFPIKHVSRDLKALLGGGFQFPKFRTKSNSKAIAIS